MIDSNGLNCRLMLVFMLDFDVSPDVGPCLIDKRMGILTSNDSRHESL